jgi:hypothetical protein
MVETISESPLVCQYALQTFRMLEINNIIGP